MKSALSLLTICGLSDLSDYKSQGVTHVLSILDPAWPEPDAFRSYDPHHRTMLRFHDAIEPGPGIVMPNSEHVEAILAFGEAIARDTPAERVHLLVHCHMGVSRSTAATLMLQAHLHPLENEGALLERLREIRPQAWPNSRMIELADALLDRKGRLMRALARYYAGQLARWPEIAEFMQQAKRGREIEMARRASSTRT
jgi:predicted protein tyrosine phosphatase